MQILEQNGIDDLDVGSIDSASGCVDVLSPDSVFDFSEFSNAVQGSQGI